MTKKKTLETQVKPEKPSSLDRLVRKSRENAAAHQLNQEKVIPDIPIMQPSNGSQKIHVSLIDPCPWQPRTHFDETLLVELSNSIKATGGIIEPIVVRRNGERFQLIAGERRWRAAKIAGFQHIDAVVRSDLPDQDAARMALLENIDREDLSDYEIAIALNNIKSQFTTIKDLAEFLNKTRKETYRYLAFLDLPEWIRARLNNKPDLINRSAAEGLKSLFTSTENAQEIYRSATERALELLEEGKLAQKNLVDQIKRFAATVNRRNSGIEVTFTRRGQKIGRMIRGDKQVQITLKALILTEEQINEIQLSIDKIIGTDSPNHVESVLPEK